MNSKQLVLDALHNKEVERIPWVPFVGCHGASLIGVNCEDYFKSEDYLVNGVLKSYEEYDPDGLPITFDLQLEAEALGCELVYSKDNPPAVKTHVLEDGVNLEDLKIPTEEDGRFPLVLNATRRIVAELGEKIALYGLITGPFTLATHLAGTSLFYDMIDDPDKVKEIMDFCKEVCINTSKMYLDAGADIIAVVDPMVSQISPDNFNEFVTPAAISIFDFIREQGKSSSFFVCGNAKRNIEEMAKTGPDNISIDENIPLDYVIETCKPYGVSVGGNIKLTLTMLFGTRMDNVNDAKNCMEIGGNKGFILSPGCDMPYATPPENVKAVTATVHGKVTDIFDEEDVMAGIEHEAINYEDKDQVIVEVVTLDSASCAPCQYMMEAAVVSAEPLGDKVKIIEYSIKDKEGVAAMMSLGVSNIPTLVVDGEVKYVSLIPSNEELTKTFTEAIEKKGIN